MQQLRVLHLRVPNGGVSPTAFWLSNACVTYVVRLRRSTSGCARTTRIIRLQLRYVILAIKLALHSSVEESPRDCPPRAGGPKGVSQFSCHNVSRKNELIRTPYSNALCKPVVRISTRSGSLTGGAWQIHAEMPALPFALMKHRCHIDIFARMRRGTPLGIYTGPWVYLAGEKHDHHQASTSPGASHDTRMNRSESY